MGKLTSLMVTRAKHRGYLADGGGLYLQIRASGAKSWVFRYRESGRLREMGLGSVKVVKLPEARVLARKYRHARLDGEDPLARKRRELEANKIADARAMTFQQCAEAYIDSHKSSWKNDKHAKQWPSSLENYAYPLIGDMSVQDIQRQDVLRVLRPIWEKKTETASRLRSRIERIIDWATMSGYREGENPAAWRGRLDKVLPPRKRVQKTRHHPALPYAEIGKFMSKVREQDAIAAAALEFLILTATRTSEVIGAKWEEIAFVESTWTIPAERMKAGREHRVPLSESALALLRRMSRLTNNAESSGYVFPGGRAGKALSNMALSQVLKRMGYAEITVHGFRSTFRDWAAEQTAFARDVCEQALAHSLPDKVEAAYRRSDLFEKRRKLMESWATFCADIRSNGEVLPMRTVSGVSRGKG